MMHIMRRASHRACTPSPAAAAAATPVAPSMRAVRQRRHPRQHHRAGVQTRVAQLDGTSPSSQGLLAQEIRSMPAQEVADTLWAYVLTHGYDPGICATVASVALEDLNKFSPAELTAILSAFAQVGHVDRDFVVVASSWLAQPYRLTDLDTGTLAQAGWVMALLAGQGVVRVEEEEEVQNFVAAVARMAQRKVNDFAPEDLARLLAAFGELQVPPPALLMQAAGDRLKQLVIPLSQLEPVGLAQVVWAFARLGSYDRALFDLAEVDLQRKAGELTWQALAQATWAYGHVREQDSKHRTLFDVNFFATMAAHASNLIQAATDASSTSTATIPTAAAAPAASQAPSSNSLRNGHTSSGSGDGVGNGHAAAAAEAWGTAGSAAQPEGDDAPPPPPRAAPEVHAPSLLTVLLTYANVSHSDGALFRQAARWFAREHVVTGGGKATGCSAQDLVVLAFAYSRVKQGAPELMASAAEHLPNVIDHMDGEDLVYLASWGPNTSEHNESLFRRVSDEALARCAANPTALSADQLLDLARCCAATIGAAEEGQRDHYTQTQQALLRAANAALISSDMEHMSTHCGATAPDTGLQK